MERVQSIEVAFGDTDQFSMDAILKYEEVLNEAHKKGVPIKALFLCSPHNPLGRLSSRKSICILSNDLQGHCYPREVLIGLMKLCQKHNIHLISDEIYALSVWQNPEVPDAVTFESVLSIDTTGIIDPGLVHVLWGMSKVSLVEIPFTMMQDPNKDFKGLRSQWPSHWLHYQLTQYPTT